MNRSLFIFILVLFYYLSFFIAWPFACPVLGAVLQHYVQVKMTTQNIKKRLMKKPTTFDLLTVSAHIDYLFLDLQIVVKKFANSRFFIFLCNLELRCPMDDFNKAI